MKFYYGVNPAEKKDKLLKSKAAKNMIDEIISSADAAITERSPAFKMSEYMLFYQNGNRKVFEQGYFDRRRKCNNIMLAFWLTEDEKYLNPLVDYISYICDEFTWCVPAHCDFIHKTPQGAIECNDLFQSETGRLFAEIVMCVGDKLPEYICERMKYEVNRRIFPTINRYDEAIAVKGYEESNASKEEHKSLTDAENKKYGWETCKMNWATVCGAGCTMAALYFGTDEEKERYVNRFTGCLDSYLEGIGDDGCCLEGMGYWNYGFVHFVILALAVKIYTDGKIDYFKNPKVKEIALFPQRVRMSGSKTASISDGGERYCVKIGLVSLLKSIYSEVKLPELQYGVRSGNVDSVCELLWFDENYQSDDFAYGTNYLPDARWYINRHEKFSFVAKGGNNDEPHNHNDIGSFMITVGEETFISDLGCGEYVKETFDNKTRYNFVQNCSRGHSVPVINGEYQHTGAQYCATNVTATENSFELNIENAYAPGIIKEIKRCFTIDETQITLTDTFDFSDKTSSVVERFISKQKPQICDGYVDFGFARIVYNSKKVAATVGTETYVAHNAVDIVTVYQIDFTPVSENERVFEFEFLPD